MTFYALNFEVSGSFIFIYSLPFKDLWHFSVSIAIAPPKYQISINNNSTNVNQSNSIPIHNTYSTNSYDTLAPYFILNTPFAL